MGHRIVAGLPKRCEGDAPDVPRRCITWYEAEAYAPGGAADSRPRPNGSSPPAARSSTVYPWGDDWDPTKANVVDSDGPAAVGTHPTGASWIGAQDMAGNAMEWVSDWLAPYTAAPAPIRPGPPRAPSRSRRAAGGAATSFVARSAYRHYEDPPTYGDEHIGFRVVTPA